MIVYDLQCRKAGHRFEAWFGSSSDYEEQRERGLLTCPACGDRTVGKAVMAPHVAAKGNQRRPRQPAADDAPAPMAVAPSPADRERLEAALAALQAHFEPVGERFPEEARRIHYGERAPAPIVGEATLAEAAELHEEGIAVVPLPLRRRRADA